MVAFHFHHIPENAENIERSIAVLIASDSVEANATARRTRIAAECQPRDDQVWRIGSDIRRKSEVRSFNSVAEAYIGFAEVRPVQLKIGDGRRSQRGHVIQSRSQVDAQ